MFQSNSKLPIDLLVYQNRWRKVFVKGWRKQNRSQIQTIDRLPLNMIHLANVRELQPIQ